MRHYLLKKIGYGILVLIGVLVIVFFLFQGLGDPARLIIGQRADASTEQNIKKELYLDQPKWKQLLFYINDIAPISMHYASSRPEEKYQGFFIGSAVKVGIKVPYLRRSYQTQNLVSTVLWQALPKTFLLAFTAMFIATLLGIGLGILAAIKKNTWLDTTAIFTSVVGISAPSFFMGIVIAYVFGFLLHDYTGLSMTGSLYEVDIEKGLKLHLPNLILPAITLGIRPMAIIAQLTRSSMLDVLSQDYIRTAQAKGLPFSTIILRHALKNALNPVITAITGWFAELLAGAFFVEYIFGWNGIGKLTVDALEKLDFPVVMGSVLITSCFFIVINIFADLLYAWIDPRIELK